MDPLIQFPELDFRLETVSKVYRDSMFTTFDDGDQVG